MSDREAVRDTILAMPNKNLLLELPTGHGKTFVALEILKQRYTKGNILVVVPRIALMTNFMAEVQKWWSDCPLTFILTTYASLHKHIGNWSAVIYDECHHITETKAEFIKHITADSSILLSATVSKDKKALLNTLFPNLGSYKRSTREAIDNGVLPDPKIYLLPLELDNENPSEIIVKNPNSPHTLTVPYEKRWQYIGKTKDRLEIICTKKQFIKDLSKQIEWWKNKFTRTGNIACKAKWLKLCRDRLIILSKYRESVAIDLLNKFRNHRTLTFCSSISQTEVLGKYCINSKNKKAIEYLNMFNNGEIKHITACDMLNEGINLTSCRIGIYAVLNSSEIMVKQKLGRLLRHKEPIIIIPYYVGTREEELVTKMLTDYNPELIIKCMNIDEIKV